MAKPMKLIDRNSNLMECRVCGWMHVAFVKTGGGFRRGAWQCMNGQCPTNIKEWDEQKQRYIKVGYRPTEQRVEE
jgi:hypothetical protein